MRLLFAFLLIFALQPIYAATLSDGVAFAFTSTASGTAPNQEFLGGKNGPTDTCTPGATFSRPNWTYLFPSLSYWTCETAGAYSRTTALFYDGVRDSAHSHDDSRGTAFYDWGAGGYTEEYFSVNIKVHLGANGEQWKIRRWTLLEDVVDWPTDPSNIPQSMRSTGVSAPNTGYVSIMDDPNGTYPNPPPNGIYYIPFDNNPYVFPTDTYFRYQSYIRFNTTGNADGIYWERITNADGSVVWEKTQTGQTSRQSPFASTNWRYSVIQNYFGNNALAYQSTIYLDDIFLQSTANNPNSPNARHRIELCTAATLPAICAPQPFTQSGASINVTAINKGQISATSGLYLLEFDNSNTIITTSGPHTLGGGGAILASMDLTITPADTFSASSTMGITASSAFADSRQDTFSAIQSGS